MKQNLFSLHCAAGPLDFFPDRCLSGENPRTVQVLDNAGHTAVFASNAIYPIDSMPGWVRVVARINPLSYEVDALRSLTLQGAIRLLGLVWMWSS